MTWRKGLDYRELKVSKVLFEPARQIAQSPFFSSRSFLLRFSCMHSLRDLFCPSFVYRLLSLILLQSVFQVNLVSALPIFERVVIDEAPPRNPWIKIVGDLNDDQRADIVIGGSAGPLVWYENPEWTRHLIAKGGYDSVSGAIADIDNDRDPDVVVGGVLWYENPGSEGLATGKPWKPHPIGTHRTHDVEAVDLDGDQRIDVIVRGQTGFGHNEGHRILIYKQRSPTFWQSLEISCPEGEGLEVVDMNQDARPDIVIGGHWYENPGAILDTTWDTHVFASRWRHTDNKVAVADLNGDQRNDVVMTPAEYKGGTHRIAWFEAPPVGSEGDWEEHAVDESVETVVHALAVADTNNDGQADIITARMHQGKPPQEVAVYVNRQRGRSWSKEVISETGSHNVIAVDIDGDGRPDIVGANHGGAYQPVELWRNISKKGTDTD